MCRRIGPSYRLIQEPESVSRNLWVDYPCLGAYLYACNAKKRSSKPRVEE